MRTSYLRKRPPASLRHEINVTPFVDVMLVLLVIFMVAAPMMSTGVCVDLPQGNSAPSLPESQPLTISLDKQGRLFLRDKEVSVEQLMESLKNIANATNERLYLRADKELSYAKVVEIMTVLIGAGYSKIALVTDSNNATK